MTQYFRNFAFVVILLVPAVSHAAIWTFQGGLNIEQSVAADAVDCALTMSCTEVPSPYFGGGFVEATLNDVTGEFTWMFNFGGLSGAAGAAHFHEAPPAAQGGVAVGVTIPAATFGFGSGSTTLMDMDPGPLDMDLTDAITALTGNGTFVAGDVTNWYLNIHTLSNPGGELRGQLFVTSVVPIPAAAWLFISALGAMVGARRFA